MKHAVELMIFDGALRAPCVTRIEERMSIQITMASTPEREDVFAELYLEGRFIGAVSRGTDGYMYFEIDPEQPDQRVLLTKLQEACEEAARRLTPD